jgi:hypothetical protein
MLQKPYRPLFISRRTFCLGCVKAQARECEDVADVRDRHPVDGLLR